MSVLVKLGLTGWFSGLVFILIACFIGLAGLDLVAGYIAGVGCVGLAVGGTCLFVEVIQYIWSQ